MLYIHENILKAQNSEFYLRILPKFRNIFHEISSNLFKKHSAKNACKMIFNGCPNVILHLLYIRSLKSLTLRMNAIGCRIDVICMFSTIHFYRWVSRYGGEVESKRMQSETVHKTK